MNPKVYARLSLGLLLCLWSFSYGGVTEFERSLNAYYQYELVTTEQGLSQGLVMNILQDHDGYIWLATPGGLDRYDGVEFDHFYHDPQNQNSLSTNEAHSLFEDRKGRLWLGMSDGSLNVMNPSRDQVHRIASDTNLVDKRFNEIKTIRELPSGRIIFLDRLGRIGTFDHCAEWSDIEAIEKWDGKRYPNLEFDREYGSVYDIEIVGDTLWVTSVNKLFYSLNFEGKSPEFIEVDLFKGKKKPIGWHNDNIRWIIHEGTNLYMTTLKGVVVSYSHTEGTSKVIDFRERYSRISISSMVRDDNGVFWINCLEGVFLYDEEADSSLFPMSKLRIGSDISAQKFAKLDNGQIIIGGNGEGFYVCSPSDTPFEYYSQGSRRARSEDLEDFIPMLRKGPNKEVIMLFRNLKRLNQQTTTFDPFGQWIEPFRDDSDRYNVNDYLVDQKGREWASSQSGVVMKDQKGKVHFFDRGKEKGYGIDSGVKLFFETRSGRVHAFASSYVLTYDEEKEVFEKARFSPDSITRWENSATSVIEAEDNSLYIGTYWGLHHIRANGEIIEHLFKGYQITDLYGPLDGSLYIATRGAGLLQFNLSSGRTKTYGVAQGLTNTTVYRIEEDVHGCLWMSSNRGLFRFERKSEEFVNYIYGSGIQGNEFNTGSSLKMGRKLAFGGMKGLTVFDPSDLETEGENIPIKIKGVSYFRDGKLHKVEVPDEIKNPEFKFNFSESRQLRFKFYWPYYTRASETKYFYSLSKDAEEWIPLGSNNVVSLVEPPEGNYELRVKAVDWKGNENEAILSIPLLIQPPWFRSPLAFTIYIILLVIGAMSFIRFQNRRIELRNQLQFERNEATRIKDLESAKTKFFSNISHEFKTPLTLLLGPISDLFRDSKDPRERHLLNIAKRNGQDLLQLINQLLDINKFEEGMLEAHYLQGELTSFVEEIAERMRPLADKRGVTLRLRLADPQSLGFDAPKVERILINLMSNAIKYAADQGLVELDLKYSDEKFIVAISDDGPGIPEDQYEDLFKPFYQVKEKDAYRAGGTGIGLSLCRDYTQIMGGRLLIGRSEYGGASFTLEVPFHDAEEDLEGFTPAEMNFDSEHKRPKDPDPGEEELPLILVVEDNPDLLAYLQITLSDDYRVITATDGKEGIERSKTYLPDIILSDIMMPQVDGIEMCQKIKARDETCHIPVILLSALSALETRLKGLDSGADDYLIKPFSKDELILRIRNLLALKESLQERFKKQYSEVEGAVPMSIEDPFVAKVEDVLEEHFDNSDFDVHQLCSEIGVSRSKLHRKLKAVSGMSATQYIRTFRLKKAMVILRQGGVTVKEVGYSVGFNSSNYFTRCFTEHFGISPSSIGGE